MSLRPPDPPVNIAPGQFMAGIAIITPSRTPQHEVFWPCSLLLSDGRTVPRALCRENPRWSDKGKWINPQAVRSVSASPFRLPSQLADKLYRAGESGMGYVIYVLALRSGETIVCASGGIVDFPELPGGVSTDDIADVFPHQGRECTASEKYFSDAPFEYCDFVPPTTSP
jgi:hypothetical protein